MPEPHPGNGTHGGPNSRNLPSLPPKETPMKKDNHQEPASQKQIANATDLTASGASSHTEPQSFSEFPQIRISIDDTAAHINSNSSSSSNSTGNGNSISKRGKSSEKLNLKLKVGYYDPFSVFPKLKNELATKSRLTNFHWKLHETDPLKKLSDVTLEWLEEIPKRTSSTNDSNDVLHFDVDNEPYIKIMFVSYSNIEEYKSKVRPLIKEWLKLNVDNKILKPIWYIVYFDDQSKKIDNVDKFTNAFKTSLFSKLKIDFNNYVLEDTSDRCFRIKSHYNVFEEKVESWNLLMMNIRTGLIESINTRLNFYTNEQLHNKDKRIILCYKDNVAKIYSAIGQIEYALKCYDELLTFARVNYESLKIKNEFHIEDLNEKTNKEEIQSNESINNERFQDHTHEINFLLNDNLSFLDLFSHIYHQQIKLLLSLNNNQANTDSAASTRSIIEGIKRLKIFINQFPTLPEAYEKSCEIIDQFLDQPILKKALLIPPQLQHDPTNDISEDHLGSLYEHIAELNLLKRNQVIKLGSVYGLKCILNFEDVAFTTEEDKQKAINKNYKIKSKEIKSILENQEVFNEYIYLSTQKIIDQFSKTKYRPQAIDTLATELAILAHSRKDFIEAAKILGDSFQYYRNQGWQFVSDYIITLYIDCLEHIMIDDPDLFLQDELINSLFIGYIEQLSNELIKNEDKAKILDKFYKLSEKYQDDEATTGGGEGFEIDISKIFDVSVHPNIINDECDIYKVKIDIVNKLNVFFKFNNIHLQLNKYKKSICDFNCESDIQPGSNEIEFKTFKFTEEDFKIIKISFEVKENLKLVIPLRDINGEYEQYIDDEDEDEADNGFENQFEKTVDSEYKVLKHNNTTDANDKQVKLPHELQLFKIDSFIDQDGNKKSNTWLDCSVPYKRDLHNDEIMLEVNIGSEDIDYLQIEFLKTDEDRLRSINNSYIKRQNHIESNDDEGEIIDDFEIVDNVDSILFNINVKDGKIAKYTRYEVYIPYFFPPDVSNTELDIAFGINFKRGEVEFSNYLRKNIDTMLPISVSVQDIFRGLDLFTNFSIGPPKYNSPLRINGVSLKSVNQDRLNDESNLKVTSWNQDDLKGIVAFGDQCATFFYKISKESNSNSNNNKDSNNKNKQNSISKGNFKSGNDLLVLNIEYYLIQEECFNILRYLFISKIEKDSKKFQKLRKYFNLLNKFFQGLRVKVNHYAQTNYLIIYKPDYSEYNNMIFNKIKNESDLKLVLNELDEFLIAFIKPEKVQSIDDTVGFYIDKSLKEKSNVPLHRLNIDVSLPLIHIVHNVELEFERRHQYVVGEPIKVEVIVNSNTSWFKDSGDVNDEEQDASDKLLEVEDSSDLGLGSSESSSTRESSQEVECDGDGDANGNGGKKSNLRDTSGIEKAKRKTKKRVLFFDKLLENKIIDNPIDLKMDIVLNESWLISGMKSIEFQVILSDSNEHAYNNKFQLILVPLKTGKIQLPRFEINSISQFNGGSNKKIIEDLTMEVDYVNSSESLLIVSELNKVTFSF
ncbi:unnamed protein product [[Candida] boidinii]|uniref:Unnamed protein product n=1 Tax=Candida boidinii TaxID=5477 RepID=A0A9W6SWL5_CANBO|nr:hypothetical protein B5S30_g2894 [[Candida] boidinii]GME68052.1 unnamed protein product [[Candida] boidinii]